MPPPMMTTSALRVASGLAKDVAVANLVADSEVFAFDERRGIVGSGLSEQSIVDGTAGSDRACDDELDEITAGMRHAKQSS